MLNLKSLVSFHVCHKQKRALWICHFAMMDICHHRLMYIVVFTILFPVYCSWDLLNCSEPSPMALLDALKPVFDLRYMRPVRNLSVYTDVDISFTLYGILGVVRSVNIFLE